MHLTDSLSKVEVCYNEPLRMLERSSAYDFSSSILLSIPNIYLYQLSIDELKWISSCFFEKVEFCDCAYRIDDVLHHKCNAFNTRDIHNPLCRCCQTRIFVYYFGMFLQKLFDEGKLELRTLSQSTLSIYLSLRLF